jgi:glycosyltransferase involved in cell wall biosynthesis
MTPAISVIIPTYNRARFLDAALDSVFAQQNAPPFEVIVVDDASTDTTAALLAARTARHANLRAIARRRRDRHGPAAARNAGLAVARAPWIAFLDSDDTWMPEKLAHFHAAIADGVTLIGSNYWMIGDRPEENRTMWDFLEQVMIPWWRGDPLIRKVIPAEDLAADRSRLTDPFTIRRMTLGGYLWPSTTSVMVRRDAVFDAGGFDERLARTEDMDLWLNLLDRGNFAYIDQPLARYNTTGRDAGQGPRYDEQAPERKHTAYLEMKAHLDFLKTLPRRFDLDAPARAFWHDRIRAYHAYCAKAADPTHPWRARWHRWRSSARS